MISGGRDQSVDYFWGALNEAHGILAGSDETSASHITPSPAPASHSTPSPATRPFFSPPTFVYPPPASNDPPPLIVPPPPASNDPPPLIVPPPPASVAPPAPTADPSAPAPDSTASTTVYVRSKRKKKTSFYVYVLLVRL